MLRCSSSLSCTTVFADAVFKRVFGSQNILLDLVPVKKPMVEGSLSWFIVDNIEIVLVSGVKGTSPDEVTENVKRVALCLLRQCGEGDALKGCQVVRRCLEDSSRVQRLLHHLDLQVRLRVWSVEREETSPMPSSASSLTPMKVNDNNNNNNNTTAEGKCEDSRSLHCSVYETDVWETCQDERLIADVSASPSLPNLLREALDLLLTDAMKKSGEFAAALFREAHLIFYTATSVRSKYGDIFFSTKTKKESEKMDEILEGNPVTQWLVSPTTYTADMEFIQCKNDSLSAVSSIAGSLMLRDDAGNTEVWDVPLVRLKDKRGLIYETLGFGTWFHTRNKHEKPLEESLVKSMEDDAGSIVRTKTLSDVGHVCTLLQLLWSQPLLQALLLHASWDDILCGRPTSCMHAEEFVRSCGRQVIDTWLAEKGHFVTVPMTPRVLHNFDPLKFLQDSLALEFGTRGMMHVSLGSLRFEYHVAVTSKGRVSTAVSGFDSLTTAVSRLFPWHAAMPRRPVLTAGPVPHHHCNNNNNNKHHSSDSITPSTQTLPSAVEKRNTTGTQGCSLDESSEVGRYCSVKVIDVEATLKSFGIVSGKCTSDSVEYSDASGKSLLKFGQMDTLQGIERFIKRLRHSSSVSFTIVTVIDNKRAPHVVACKAFAGISPQKVPPYMRKIRIPIPLISGEFFSLRFTDLLDKEHKCNALLSIIERYSFEPAQWPLNRPAPCFFNEWRLTRGIIHSILRYDPLFRYTIERLPVKDGSEMFLLRFYSGEEMTDEVHLEERLLLQQVRSGFIQYATRWDVTTSSLTETTFLMNDIRKSFVASYKGFVSALLHNSEVVTRNGPEAVLELRILDRMKIRLASTACINQDTQKEELSRMFLEQQFPELLTVASVLRRAHHFVAVPSSGDDKTRETTFHCREINGERLRFRWELQVVAGDGGSVEVVGAAEDSSRFGALAALVDELNSRDKLGHLSHGTRTIEAKKARKTKASLSALLPETIEGYQRELARQLRVMSVVHNYSATNNVLIVKGINHDGDNAEGGSEKIIRVIPICQEYGAGEIIHRYYRRELNLADPPQKKNDALLRVDSLKLIYDECQRHFPSPLPPLEESIIEELEKGVWNVILRLPAKCFALGGSGHVEYVYRGRRKHEGRRYVVCKLYRALYGEAPKAIEHILSKVFSCEAPPPPPPLDADNICSSTPESSIKYKKSGIAIKNNDNNDNNNNSGGIHFSKNREMRKDGMTGSAGGDSSMYSELLKLIYSHFRRHVDYDGVVECRLSYITGFTGRYIPTPGGNGEVVNLFNSPFRSTVWLPLQLLAVLFSCARQLVPEEELEMSLLRSASGWPSLFVDTKQSERLFCMTFLRRYLGLWTFEENDVGVSAGIPGSIYLLERTQRVRPHSVQASLSLVQTPLKLTGSAKFSKTLTTHTSSSISRAESIMWGAVLGHLPRVDDGQEPNADKTVLETIMRIATDMTR